MKRFLTTLCLAAALPALAQAEPAAPQAIAGVRLDVVTTGEVDRVPDLARINAGVVAVAPTASAALAENSRRMTAVQTALRRTGIEDRDIQTSSVSLYPQYRQDGAAGTAPQIVGYQATNEVAVRFRDIAAAGAILDALVAQGANQINGPTFQVSKPDEALDEARVKALAAARARAELYARAIGRHVGRILSISEAGAAVPFEPRLVNSLPRAASAPIAPGTQTLSVTLSLTFELD